MTKSERKEFVEAWQETENIITVIVPTLSPEVMFKRPEESGPKEIKLLLQFLRIAVKDLLHDKESTVRERDSLLKMLKEEGTIGGS